MKRMLTLSLAIHLVVGMLFVLLTWIGERRIEGSIYTVNLITPTPEIKRAALEPKREQAPKITKPLSAKPVPLKRETKHQPAPKPTQKVAHLKPVPQLEPPRPAVQPSPSPTVPETVPSPPPQQSPAPAPSEEAALTKPVAKAVMDVPHFKFPLYGALIEKRISALWSPPPLIVGLEGKETIVSFQLSRSGRIQDVQIEKSSGNNFYDQAALRAIYEADPLPPWPQGFHEISLKIYFRFELGKEG